MATPENHPAPTGLAGRLASLFIDSKLTPLIIIGSVLLGIFATLLLPREEEPQIKVPMVDVMVSMPGGSERPVTMPSAVLHIGQPWGRWRGRQPRPLLRRLVGRGCGRGWEEREDAHGSTSR